MTSKILEIGSECFAIILLGTIGGMRLPGNDLVVLAAPGAINLVSIDSNGTVGNDYSRHGDISPDGKYVIFDSVATNLITGEPIGSGGLFIHDLQTKMTSRVLNDGEEGVISGGGRFVAYVMLVQGESSDVYQVFVKDLQSGISKLVSASSTGVPGNDWSGGPDISDDGRFIAYYSVASNLVAGDTNDAGDIFLYDQQTGLTERVSMASGGAQANGGSGDPAISADGRIVVFSSNATNLIAGDTNGRSDIFARDRLTGTTTRVSVNSAGVEADRGARDSSVSANGRFVSFSSSSTNLMNEDSLEFEHVYVHDLQTGATTLASRYTQGTPMQGNSEQSTISADGRLVAFQYDDRGDAMPIFVIVLHDRQTGMTKYITPSRGASGDPSISADGRYLTFTSDQSLVSADTNGTADVYLNEVALEIDLSPRVESIQYSCAINCYPSPATLSFRVTFSEFVTGVGLEDFQLSVTGGISGASIDSITGTANEYLVNVTTGSGDGTLRLDLMDDDGIKDIALNPLGGPGVGNGNFTAGELYVVDKNLPSVLGVTRLDPSPAAGMIVHFAITFSEDVSGVDVTDLMPFPSGTVIGAAVVEVTGAGSRYTASVSTGSGEGSLKLNVIDNDSIRDGNNHSIGGDGPDNGTFTSGEAYAIDRIPMVFSILRVDPTPSAADTVTFRATFSEPVAGVDPGDFLLTQGGGLSGSSIISVSPLDTGSVYSVLVNNGKGEGTLRLDLIDNDSIVDATANPLGGPGPGNGNYITGDAYTIVRTVRSITSVSFRSNGTNDGWVLESSEESSQGGLTNPNTPFLVVGDDSQDRQIRSILHFPTYYLPDNAVVTQAILAIRAYGISGTDPFQTHGNLILDIMSGFFGSPGFFGFNSLDSADFQDPASMNSAGSIVNNPVGGWYWCRLNPLAYPYINPQGITQIRLRFELEDNDDLGDDIFAFISGDHDQLGERPRLIVEYYSNR